MMGDSRAKGSLDNTNLNGLAYNYDTTLNKLTKILKLRQGGDCLKHLEDLWDTVNRPIANNNTALNSKISSVRITPHSNNLVNTNCRLSPLKLHQSFNEQKKLVQTNSVSKTKKNFF